jgi:hypothetical protein
MVFPKFHIEDQKAGRTDLTRFDLDYDLPDHFLPEFPSPSISPLSDLRDVSQERS